MLPLRLQRLLLLLLLLHSPTLARRLPSARAAAARINSPRGQWRRQGRGGSFPPSPGGATGLVES